MKLVYTIIRGRLIRFLPGSGASTPSGYGNNYGNNYGN